MKSQVQRFAATRTNYADGSIVLAQNGWEHDSNGRLVVLFTRDKGIRLCPLTSKDYGSGAIPSCPHWRPSP